MEWIKDNRRMLTFFTVVLASVSLNLYLYRSSQSSYEASHEMIVRQYNAQILKSVKAINGVTKYVPAKNSTRSDSLFADLQAQYLQVLEDQKLFQESVKSMLELEFSKIQNEYETQEIWIGLITIVFLIFSFYSMMKSEQFEQQCREDARKVHDWTDGCQSVLDNIDTAKEAKLKNIEDAYKMWKDAKDESLKNQTITLVSREMESFRNEKDAKIKEITNMWDVTISSNVQRIMADIETLEKSTEAECKEHTKNLLATTEQKLNQEIQRMLDEADNELKGIRTLVDKRIEEYVEEHSIKPEDIDSLFDDVFGTGNAMKDASAGDEEDSTEPNKDDNDE